MKGEMNCYILGISNRRGSDVGAWQSWNVEVVGVGSEMRLPGFMAMLGFKSLAQSVGSQSSRSSQAC